MTNVGTVSYRDAASQLGVHLATLHRWRKKGILPVPVRKYAPTGQYVMTDSDVRAIKMWMNDPVVFQGEPAFVAA